MRKFFTLSLIPFCLACFQIEPQESINHLDLLKKSQAEEAETKKKIRLVFIGDIMAHGNQITSAYDDSLKSHDYKPWFEAIEPLLKQADWAFGNLELTLTEKPPYSGYPMFRSPDAMGRYLKEAGFDVLVTANNHSNDGGAYGLRHTLDVLDSLHILHTGTFRDSSERADNYPLILEKGAGDARLRLALLNFTYGTNGVPTKKPGIVNPIDTNEIRIDIEKAKKQKVHAIIAFVHWGDEYKLRENKKQQQLAHWLREQGVDWVIGAHPHVVEPIVRDTVLNEPGLVAYSLGNYISNQERPHTDIGILLQLELEHDLSLNRLSLSKVEYLPLWRHIDKSKPATKDWVYRALPLSWIEADTLHKISGMSPDLRKKALQTGKALVNRLEPWSIDVLNYPPQ